MYLVTEDIQWFLTHIQYVTQCCLGDGIFSFFTVVTARSQEEQSSPERKAFTPTHIPTTQRLHTSTHRDTQKHDTHTHTQSTFPHFRQTEGVLFKGPETQSLHFLVVSDSQRAAITFPPQKHRGGLERSSSNSHVAILQFYNALLKHLLFCIKLFH